MPLHYVLLFPRGDIGYHKQLYLGHDGGQRKKTNMERLHYYKYRLHIRPTNKEPDHIFHAGKLFQQYIVDTWASSDQCNLRWYRFNQNQFRADIYNGISDALAYDEVNTHSLGLFLQSYNNL